MQVSISMAAKMAGITRSTLYDHIKDKGISLIDANTKRPKIDVSELIRVYGDKVKLPEEINDNSKNVKSLASHSNDPTLSSENKALKEKVEMLEKERDRERRQLTEQIENLQDSLKKEQETVSKITALLSDQRPNTEKVSEKEFERIERLEKSLEHLLKTKKNGFFGLFNK